MKLLVTGGGGYLGGEVCRQAVAAGHDVLATQLRTPARHGRAVTLDLRDGDAVERVFMRHGPEVVVHTAYRQAEDDLEGDVVRATRNVAAAAHRCGARLVHVSTDHVFAGQDGAPFDEAAEPRTVFPYGAAKVEAERLARRLHPEAAIVRTSLLYGLVEPGPQERMALVAAHPFFADEIRCPARAADVAARLLEPALPPLSHAVGADAVTRVELARRLRAAHGHDPDAIEEAAGVRPWDLSLSSTLLPALPGVREVLN